MEISLHTNKSVSIAQAETNYCDLNKAGASNIGMTNCSMADEVLQVSFEDNLYSMMHSTREGSSDLSLGEQLVNPTKFNTTDQA